MGTPVIRGEGGMVVKPYEVYFDPRRGLSVKRKFTAAGGDAALLGMEAAAQAAGYTTRKIVSPVLSELEISSPELDTGGGGDNTVTDQWELVGNEISKSVYENAGSIGIEQLSPGILGHVKASVQRYFDSGGTMSYASAIGTIGGYNIDVISEGLFDLLVRDTNTYLTGQYVLRHTTNCSASYGGNVSDDNVFCIHTTAQLLTECQDSTLWIKPLAGRLVTAIGNIPSPVARTGYLWGWLKKPSTHRTTPDNRIDVTTEYWLEQWSTWLYSTV